MKGKILIAFFVTLSLAACAGTGADYEPIVDGPKGPKYSGDLASCQKLAKERKYINPDVKTGAVVGASIYGVLGAVITGDVEGAVAGAGLGALAGGGEEAYKVKNQRRSIVISCMQQRGYRVMRLQ